MTVRKEYVIISVTSKNVRKQIWWFRDCHINGIVLFLHTLLQTISDVLHETISHILHNIMPETVHHTSSLALRHTIPHTI